MVDQISNANLAEVAKLSTNLNLSAEQSLALTGEEDTSVFLKEADADSTEVSEEETEDSETTDKTEKKGEPDPLLQPLNEFVNFLKTFISNSDAPPQALEVAKDAVSKAEEDGKISEIYSYVSGKVQQVQQLSVAA